MKRAAQHDYHMQRHVSYHSRDEARKKKRLNDALLNDLTLTENDILRYTKIDSTTTNLRHRVFDSKPEA